MERSATTRGGTRKNSRRSMTILWIAGLAVLVIALLYFEQTAILYLLATLGVTALLIIVALSDLSGAKRSANASDLGDDAAALGSGLNASAAAVSLNPNPVRRAAAKRK